MRKGQKKVVAWHGGDCGDVIAFLPVLRHLGGGTLVLGDNSAVTAPNIRPRESMSEGRFNFIRPLLEAQPYVKKLVHQHDYTGATIDMSFFRSSPTTAGESLLDWQARYAIGQLVDNRPWLTVTPSDETRGRTVIARSLRYQNPMFGWSVQIAKAKNPIFVGLPEEYRSFCMAISSIPHRKVDNALEMAQLIAGSNLFIGNQSLPCWIAMALGHPLIQETWPQCQNSRVERDNTSFVLNGLGSNLSQLPWLNPQQSSLK